MSDVRENKQNLQTAIQSLGNAIARILPEDWERVVVGYFIVGENNVPHIQFHVITMSSDDYSDLMAISWDSDEFDDEIIEVQQLCETLRRICSVANDNWSTMTFSMIADGTFNVDYDYDVIDKYDPAFILNWQSQHLI